MSGTASIGFRLHTGWAVLVAVAREEDGLRVLHRCRVELLGLVAERFVYHQAAKLPLAEAEKLIDGVRNAAETASLTNIRSAIGNLEAARACISGGSMSVPDDLSVVLQSHARIHAAEGALYFGAAASACRRLGLPVVAVRERDVWLLASASARMSEVDLKARIDALRSSLGPPWTADHKIATAAALVKA